METSIFVALSTFLFFTSVLPSIVEGLKQCTAGARYDRHINKKFVCGVSKTFAANRAECHLECTSTLNCWSTNFYQESADGTEFCDLINGTKESFSENASCMVEKNMAEHNQLLIVDFCPSLACRKALPDGWLQLASFAVKLFHFKKSLHEANLSCAEQNATLATIDSELENRFVAENFVSLLEAPKARVTSLSSLNHWHLGAPHPNITLHGGAYYDQFFSILRLPGINGAYATTPAFYIQNISFTMALWVKLQGKTSYLYSSWGSPPVFSIVAEYASDVKKHTLVASIKGVCCSPFLNLKSSKVFPSNKWTHVALTLEKIDTGLISRLYQDGSQVHAMKRTYQNPLLVSNPSNVFDIGLKRQNLNPIKGYMKDLIVWDRWLLPSEIKTLFKETGPTIHGAWIGVPKTSYTNWAPGYQTSPQCLFIRGVASYQWDKEDCHIQAPYICKKKIY